MTDAAQLDLLALLAPDLSDDTSGDTSPDTSGDTSPDVSPMVSADTGGDWGDDFSPFGRDLLGEPIRQARTGLAGDFVVPPFSVLNTGTGMWQDRKRAWLSLGIRSELGRAEALVGSYHHGLSAQLRERQGVEEGGRVRTGAYGAQAITDPDTGELVYETTVGSTSVFDPVLCELVYRWFSPPGGHVLDPFAGGSVRGLVAAYLGRRYTGIELRPEQVQANRGQRGLVPTGAPCPVWVNGDSLQVLASEGTRTDATRYDLVFSCPPYADLEVYSDDPRDISNMTWDGFCGAHGAIIRHATALLRPNAFAAWVIGDVRDPRGNYRALIAETIAAFRLAGLHLYNDAIVVTPAGSLPVRAGLAFRASRKLGRTHQHLLVFTNGDGKAAARACQPTEGPQP